MDNQSGTENDKQQVTKGDTNDKTDEYSDSDYNSAQHDENSLTAKSTSIRRFKESLIDLNQSQHQERSYHYLDSRNPPVKIGAHPPFMNSPF